MTIENSLPHGLKTSLLGSTYKTEYDQNLTLLDKNRVTVGTFANRPVAGTAERFYYATDTGDFYYDDGTTWLAVSATTATAHASTHASGGSDAVTIEPTQVIGLATSLTGKADSIHTHLQSEVTNLVADLAGKSPTTHTHTGVYEPADAGIQGHIADVTNPHSVTKVEVGLPNVQNTKVNLVATAAPVATDDSNAGYSVGSKWIDVTNDKSYICVDATVGSAIWHQIDSTGAGGGTSIGKNLLINALGTINQRGVTNPFTAGSANQYFLDRWRVVVATEQVSFTTTNNVVTMTAPAGGLEQVIEGLNIQSGTHVISWTGTATCTVDGVAKTSGDTFTLTGGTNATVKFSNGTVSKPQVEAGSSVTTFENRNSQSELVKCQRYYQQFQSGDIGNNVTDNIDFVGDVTNANSYWGIKNFAVIMRIVPTVTLTHDNGASFPTSVGVVDVGISGFRESRVANATVARGWFRSFWTASAEV